jgi:hypothetical protein
MHNRLRLRFGAAFFSGYLSGSVTELYPQQHLLITLTSVLATASQIALAPEAEKNRVLALNLAGYVLGRFIRSCEHARLLQADDNQRPCMLL